MINDGSFFDCGLLLTILLGSTSLGIPSISGDGAIFHQMIGETGGDIWDST